MLDLTPGQVTFADGQVAELQKILNDIITKNLVKFKFANCKQKQRRDRASSRGRVPFSGNVSAVDRASGIQEVNRYASLQRTIENEHAERQQD